ncbi:MAG: alkaline phosphatase D family protein [Verrucomicrobia bacterium]|nr:alkaline phosphatase D family protein [Verrucomicrobiota bacterium]
MNPPSKRLSRRAFVVQSTKVVTFIAAIAALLGGLSGLGAESTAVHQATGVKVGEVTDLSAIVWMRLTAAPLRNNAGEVVKGHIGGNAAPKPVPTEPAKLEGACPGTPGQVRVRYGTHEDLSGAKSTDWAEVSSRADFAHQFLLTGLQPATTYFFASETAGPGGSPRHGALRGRFETAPTPTQVSEITFCVVTGQMYADLDHIDGFNIYPAMAKLNPKYVVFTGDNVYYDSEEPRAVTPALARYHWERMYSLPRHVDLLRHVASYWEKDDHDTWENDSWPGLKSQRMGEFKFSEGQRIFLEQVPMGGSIYRTFRCGKLLQIWLTDGRDFRSPNNQPDGPEKTIWGREQKECLKRTLKESDATWKVIVSPTPIVGPDRGNKNDNHANKGFRHEGDEIRAWLQSHVPDNCFVVCGDRHWQYHSVNPQTELHEFSVGPASDEHAAGSPGFDAEYHKFHRVKGGFLSVTVGAKEGGNSIRFQHRDVHGNVVYDWAKNLP